MRALLQRVSTASVIVEDENYIESIDDGILILLGIKTGDTIEDVNFVADKCSNLRIFEDENLKMNKSVLDIQGEALIISQFTLYADPMKGNRPSFTNAARPETANDLYEKFIERMKLNLGAEKIKSGIFASMMDIKSINKGPVTILVESKPKVSN